jgi:hypothetical protein
VAGAPEDHDFGGGIGSPGKVIYGPVLDSTPTEKIQGLIWNSLLGDGESWPMDIALTTAVESFTLSRGVLLDHREGHGGTAPTANILVSFARTPYTPFINAARNRASDEGPVDTAAAIQRFNQYKSQSDIFGSASAQTDIPVALLTTWDVSASDFLLKIMQGGPKVRLFGPGPSMGAFGTFMQYSTWGVMRWSVDEDITQRARFCALWRGSTGSFQTKDLLAGGHRSRGRNGVVAHGLKAKRTPRPTDRARRQRLRHRRASSRRRARYRTPATTFPPRRCQTAGGRWR